MPRTKEQYEEMRLKSKSIIIDTALNLFVTNGYHSTSISAIAKEAGIAIGLIYHYFKSKEDLLIYIMDEHMQQIKNAVAHELLSKTSDSKDIRVIIDSLFSIITQRSDSWRLIISVLFQPDVANSAKQLIEALSIHQQQLYEAYFNRIGAIHPVESAKTVAAVLHGALLSFALSGNIEELRIICNNVIEKLVSTGV